MNKGTRFIGQPMYGQLLNLLDKQKILRFSRESGVQLKRNGQVVIDRLAVLPDGGYKKMRQNTPYKPIFKTIDFERDAIMKVTYIVHNTNKYDKEHPYPDLEM